MRKAISIWLLLIMFLLGITKVKAQNTDRWRAGSAKTLEGKVVLLIAFISTNNTGWNKYEKEKINNNIDEVEKWFSNQAINYSTSLYFDKVILNNNNDIYFDTIEPGLASGKERVDWVYRIMLKMGYKNSKQAFRKLSKRYNTKNIVVLIFANGNGRPYSMRYAKHYSKKKYFMEGAIVYNSYLNGAPVPYTVVTAHEMLHLFGAWDLYKTYAQTSNRQQLATKLYPNDIMLTSSNNINLLNINSLTAWLIGWNKYNEEIFEWFRPSDYKQ